MGHWSEKERWCLGNLTLGSKFPLDVIEVCHRREAITKIGTTKINHVYLNNSEHVILKTVQTSMQTSRQD